MSSSFGAGTAPGDHCAWSACNRLDFLPIKCYECDKSFCDEHSGYDQHDCPNKYKVVKEALHCPLCKVIIAPKPGEDPNMVMSRHIDSGCVNPDAGKVSAYKYPCSKKKCKKKGLVQMLCATCRLNFCTAHRYESSHDCLGEQRQARSAAAASSRKKAAPSTATAASASSAASSAGGSGGGNRHQAYPAPADRKQKAAGAAAAARSKPKPMKQTQLKLNGQVGRDLRKEREDRERQKAGQLRDQQNALGVSEDEAMRMAIAASMGGSGDSSSSASTGAGAGGSGGANNPAQPSDAATADLELAMAMSASMEGKKKTTPKKKDDEGCCLQ